MNLDRKVQGTVERGVAVEAGNSNLPDAARKQTTRSSSLHTKLCSQRNLTVDRQGSDRKLGEGNQAERQELLCSAAPPPALLDVLRKG